MKRDTCYAVVVASCVFAACAVACAPEPSEAEVRRAFANRSHLVDGTPGFVRLEVLAPLDDPREIWLLTYWSDEASFQEWHRGHLHKEAHKGIPRGLKLIPGRTEIRHFEHVCS